MRNIINPTFSPAKIKEVILKNNLRDIPFNVWLKILSFSAIANNEEMLE